MVNFCMPCRRALHNSCKAVLLEDLTYCECTHGETNLSEKPTENILSSNSASTSSTDLPELDDIPTLFSTDEPDEVIRVSGSRRNKPDSALKDQQSTGRKRAAKLYPLDRSAECEWANKKQAGGGVTIIGCGIRLRDNKTVPVGLQQSRHHGPDYNTLNNDPGNVHRICHSCHNAWHAVNDPNKDENYMKLYGVKPSKEALSSAAKELRSGGPKDESGTKESNSGN